MMTTREIFAKKVSEARRGTDYTQDQVATEVGVNLTSYRSYEAGRVFPRPETIDKLATLFRKPIHWFFQDGTTLSGLIEESERNIVKMQALLKKIKSDG